MIALRPCPMKDGEVRRILAGQRVTSYNTNFDINRFLMYPPWSITEICDVCGDLMAAATDVMKLPSPLHDGYKWPSLMQAYSLTEHDPAGIDGNQDHRALSDARVASYVLLELVSRDAYIAEVIA